jgi:branched-chain amino acid transport system permease protein
MVIIGGSGTLIGPVLGAGLILILQNIISSSTERWPTVMGIIFVVFVFAARRGLMGLVRQALDEISARTRAKAETIASTK